MSYPHPIRLRGPWEYTALARSLATADSRVIESHDDLPPTGRATVPGDWGDTLGEHFRGRVRYRRHFNSPPSLAAGERLWLVVEGLDAYGEVVLNGAALGAVRGYALPAEFDITAQATPRNELLLEVELPAVLDDASGPLRPGRAALPGGPVGAVRLEVRSSWHLERLAVWTETVDGPRLHIVGRVAGPERDEPLAVVVTHHQRELLFGEVMPGAEFQLCGSAESLPHWPEPGLVSTPAELEIKLIAGGAACWQTRRSIAVAQVKPELLRRALHCARILDEAHYHQADVQGKPLAQAMPLDWALLAAPRLAHHPSIVAWTTTADELQRLTEEQRRVGLFGRSWALGAGR